MTAAPVPSSGLSPDTADPLAPAPLARRLAAFTYEGVLLFGVVMIGAYLYDTLTQHRHALQGRAGLQAFLFLLLAVYFVWFWTHGGQTLAMKTWRVKLVTAQGGPLTQTRALLRYAASWLWFLPALATAHYVGPRSSLAIFGLLLVGVAAYAALALTNAQRQFLHDLLCGTRLIDARVGTPVTQPAG